jgi:hypothetical protein
VVSGTMAGGMRTMAATIHCRLCTALRHRFCRVGSRCSCCCWDGGPSAFLPCHRCCCSGLRSAQQSFFSCTRHSSPVRLLPQYAATQRDNAGHNRNWRNPPNIAQSPNHKAQPDRLIWMDRCFNAGVIVTSIATRHLHARRHYRLERLEAI